LEIVTWWVRFFKLGIQRKGAKRQRRRVSGNGKTEYVDPKDFIENALKPLRPRTFAPLR
jgi:hypothetical protein